MKIIINTCFGGFGLSHKAIMEYGKRKGTPFFVFTEKRDANGNLMLHKFVPVTKVGNELFVHYSTKPLMADGTYDRDSYFSPHNIDRQDKDLIAIVEEMGSAADGCHAELKVVEVPDGIEWGIHEYDGLEHVEEKHRTWS